MLLHQFGKTKQDLPALGGAHGAPGAFEGAAGGGNGALDIGLVAFGNGRDDLFGGRIERLEGAPGERRDVLAVDQQQPGLGGRDRGRVVWE